ncbi:MAG: M14 family zinc carboxypeptidase [Bacteroidetes bacterium]|nr:M14 family zinc carboxypeptidase [Bacteroidota bacterium]
MHHAREPIGMQQLLFYMYYLLENYATDPVVQYIVNNTEMYFIPIINPDGYEYNRSTDPEGGGMWRKNRSNNGGGSYGIDLNRNYNFMWGFDDVGSSPDPFYETYRGTAGFSEFETQSIRDFTNSHNFKLALNYHSFGNDLLSPWGYTGDSLTMDDSIFSGYAGELTKENHYTTGTVSSTLYLSNGGSDDWMYGEQLSKPKVFAYTPEVGTANDGFWPMPERIIPLSQGTMWQNVLAALMVIQYATVKDLEPLFIPHQGYLHYNIRRLGMQPGTFTVTVQPLGSDFQSTGPAQAYNSLNYMQTVNDSVSFQLNPWVQDGQYVQYLLKISNGSITFTDTLTKVVGEPVTIFSDPLDNASNWTGGWALTSGNYFSPPSSMTDSPLGDYDNNIQSSETLSGTINLTNAAMAVLSFQASWALEYDYDYVQLKISKDNGISWAPVAGHFTRPGSVYEATGEPLYDGVHPAWVKEEINLADYLGYNIKLRFTITTDNGTTMDGFYFDDVTVQVVNTVGIPENQQTGIVLSDPVPNPANQSVIFHLSQQSDNQLYTIELLNVTGQRVREMRTFPGNNVMGTGDIQPGVYFYRFSSGTEVLKTGKLLISR